MEMGYKQMLHYFTPVDVCSSRFCVKIDGDGVIANLEIEDGCEGYARGIGRLVEGRNAKEIIALLDGVLCESSVTGRTSCPDQIAKMLAEILKKTG